MRDTKMWHDIAGLEIEEEAAMESQKTFYGTGKCNFQESQKSYSKYNIAVRTFLPIAHM